MAKLSQEELDKLIAQAPRNDKGQSFISDEDFMDNVKNLPYGTRSESGYFAKDGGYITPVAKGTKAAKELASKGGKASVEMYRERKKWAESIDIYLKKTDENGVSNQDKIVMGMIAKAMEGCVGASEFLRDTVGEKPTDQVSLDVMTEGDKQLMEILKKRLGYDGSGSTEKQ